MTQDTHTPQAEEQPGPSALDALDATAAALDGAAADAAQPAPAAPVATNTAAELRSALELARIAAQPAFAWWPEFGTVWSDRTLEGIAVNGGAIMDRHGWSLGDVMTTWGPYVGLAGTLGPAVLVTVQAVKAQKARAEAPQTAQAPAPTPDP